MAPPSDREKKKRSEAVRTLKYEICLVTKDGLL